MPRPLAPMLATTGDAVPDGEGWTFEPKYDGVRVLARRSGARVTLTTRNGINKAPQFPEVAAAVAALRRARNGELVLDGELVSRDGASLGRFQSLQGRLHARDPDDIRRHAAHAPAVLVVFDVLVVNGRRVVREPWSVRRQLLEGLLPSGNGAPVQLGATTTDSSRLLAHARRKGWEGIMAKRVDAPYAAGERSRRWLKLKLEGRQEFVVGGWTEPRRSRQHIGALLLGYYDEAGRLHYAGHAGGGFTHAGLAEMAARLAPLERSTSPFAEVPVTNERPHWTRPQVVVEVKFNEWTADGRLRQPIVVGVRDDKRARDVRREGGGMPTTDGSAGSAPRQSPVARRIDALQQAGAGELRLTQGKTLALTNLRKVFFPESGLSKGDVLAYYADVAPALLPVMKDRPLVLKRYPDGVGGKSFYQQNAPTSAPEGVRIEGVVNNDGKTNDRLIGGDLLTLLYSVQSGAIEVHPWHARVGSIDFADYTILDLDPGARAPFTRVVQVARWVGEVLEEYGLHAALKTSGSSGLHIYVPLPPRTPHESARLLAQMIASSVAEAHPREATVARALKKRAEDAVYVDYLQNVEGKSVAAPFSLRAKEPARVSMPLAWDELTDSLDPHAFTPEVVVRDLAHRRALWTTAMRRRNSLARLLDT